MAEMEAKNHELSLLKAELAETKTGFDMDNKRSIEIAIQLEQNKFEKIINDLKTDNDNLTS
jgi:hypothetical protein